MARTRNYSLYTLEALKLMGSRIRAARIERHLSTQDLATRAGVSRDMLYRVERGDPRCEIGVVFELAAIVGVPLFEPDRNALVDRNRLVGERLALLPKAIHERKVNYDDDF